MSDTIVVNGIKFTKFNLVQLKDKALYIIMNDHVVDFGYWVSVRDHLKGATSAWTKQHLEKEANGFYIALIAEELPSDKPTFTTAIPGCNPTDRKINIQHVTALMEMYHNMNTVIRAAGGIGFKPEELQRMSAFDFLATLAPNKIRFANISEK